ncbi:MAG: hypothetical protein LBQ79_10395 [Deltaproteobacteria bacterium]|nr:hypothetical protein [Deltaproteobacteria bacterium]
MSGFAFASLVSRDADGLALETDLTAKALDAASARNTARTAHLASDPLPDFRGRIRRVFSGRRCFLVCGGATAGRRVTAGTSRAAPLTLLALVTVMRGGPSGSPATDRAPPR